MVTYHEVVCMTSQHLTYTVLEGSNDLHLRLTSNNYIYYMSCTHLVYVYVHVGAILNVGVH